MTNDNTPLIPQGCTHWAPHGVIIEGQPARYNFYKAYGPANEVIKIWWRGKWTAFEEYQEDVAADPRCRGHVPKPPELNLYYFNRHCETANDKLKKIAARC